MKIQLISTPLIILIILFTFSLLVSTNTYANCRRFDDCWEVQRARERAEKDEFIQRSKRQYQDRIEIGATVLRDGVENGDYPIENYIGTVTGIGTNDYITIRFKINGQRTVSTYKIQHLSVTIQGCIDNFCSGDLIALRESKYPLEGYKTVFSRVKRLFSNRVMGVLFEGQKKIKYFEIPHKNIEEFYQEFGVMVQCYQGLCAGNTTQYNGSKKVEVLAVYNNGVVQGYDKGRGKFVDWIRDNPGNTHTISPSASRSWVRWYLPRFNRRIKRIKANLRWKKRKAEEKQQRLAEEKRQQAEAAEAEQQRLAEERRQRERREAFIQKALKEFSITNFEVPLEVLSTGVYPNKAKFMKKIAAKIKELDVPNILSPESWIYTTRLFYLMALKPFMENTTSKYFKEKVFAKYKISLEREIQRSNIKELYEFEPTKQIRIAALNLIYISLITVKEFVSQSEDQQAVGAIIAKIGRALAQAKTKQVSWSVIRDLLALLDKHEDMISRLALSPHTKGRGLIISTLREYFAGNV